MKDFIKQRLREDLGSYSKVIGSATHDEFKLSEIIGVDNQLSKDTNEDEINQEGDYGYHAGDLTNKSGVLSANSFMPTLKSQLGTGHFFFGDINDAKYLSGEKKGSEVEPELRKTKIYAVDFSKYNMFRPSNAVELYDNLIIPMMQALNQLGPEDVDPNKEGLVDIANYYRSLGINISDENFLKITHQYLTDMFTKQGSTDDNLNTRIMKSVGYEGVDLRGSAKDGISNGRANVGSVIFDIRPDTIKTI